MEKFWTPKKREKKEKKTPDSKKRHLLYIKKKGKILSTFDKKTNKRKI